MSDAYVIDTDSAARVPSDGQQVVARGHGVRVDGFEAWTIDADGLIAASIGSCGAQEYARQLAVGV